MQGQQATHLFGPALIGIRTVCVYIRRDRQFHDGTHREQKRRERKRDKEEYTTVGCY